jgi:hypothetical protein
MAALDGSEAGGRADPHGRGANEAVRGRAHPARRAARALCLWVCLAGCSGPGVYVKAAQTFAEATTVGIDGLGPSTATAQRICLLRAESQFLRQRLSGERPWGSNPKRSQWFRDPAVGPDGTLSWSQSCEEIGKIEQGFKRIHAGLGAYAAALQAVGDKAQVDVDRLGSVAKVANELSGRLLVAGTRGANVSGKMTNALAGAAKPLSAVAGFFEQLIASKDLRRTVKKTDPPVQALLDQLLVFSATVKDEALALQNDTEVLLNQMDAAMREVRPDPLRAGEFGDYSRRAEQGARDQLAVQDRTRQALEDLKAAHGALADGTDKTDDQILSLVSDRRNSVTAAVKDIHQLLHLDGGTP